MQTVHDTYNLDLRHLYNIEYVKQNTYVCIFKVSKKTLLRPFGETIDSLDLGESSQIIIFSAIMSKTMKYVNITYLLL